MIFFSYFIVRRQLCAPLRGLLPLLLLLLLLLLGLIASCT